MKTYVVVAVEGYEHERERHTVQARDIPHVLEIVADWYKDYRGLECQNWFKYEIEMIILVSETS